jgi:hypothetical protein
MNALIRVRLPWLRLSSLSGLILALSLLGPSPKEATGAMQRRPAGDSIDRVLQRYERVRMDVPGAARQVRETGDFQFTARGVNVDVVLEPYDLRASGYRAEEELPGGGTRTMDSMPIRTYRGTSPSLRNAEARFTIKDDSLEGVVLTPSEWYYIEPMSNFSPASDPSEMVIYRRSDIRLEALGACGTALAHRVGEAHELVEPQMLAASAGISVADIATEADYEFVVASGGATAANAAILEILNQVDGIYQTELSVSLHVVYQHAWSTSDDPYTSTNSSNMLTEFVNYWNSNYYSVPFDLAHLWTGKDMDGSVVGIAYVGAVCGARNYSYGVSQRITSSPGKYILTAHEIAHNFGASHSDQSECSNTIMNSFIGTGLTFCPFSRSEITAYVASNSSCLASTTSAPSNLTATSVSSSQINLSWQDNSADETGFVIERKPGAAGTWAQINTTSANVTLYGDSGLATNTTYYYRVQSAGSSGPSNYSNEASATTLASGPAISGISPGSGRPGTLVTISGANLNGATAVRFNTTYTASFTVVSASQVTASVPAGATTGRISVTTPLGTATSAAVFTVSRCDINGDGSVNVLDIQLIINSILGIFGAPSSCDINGDGITNVLDLQLLINVVLGSASCPG